VYPLNKKINSHNSSAHFCVTHSESTRQEDVLSQLPFKLVLKHESMNIQENSAGVQRKGSLQVLADADDNYLQDKNMKSTAKKGCINR
jgi:hypothetical protein